MLLYESIIYKGERDQEMIYDFSFVGASFLGGLTVGVFFIIFYFQYKKDSIIDSIKGFDFSDVIKNRNKFFKGSKELKVLRDIYNKKYDFLTQAEILVDKLKNELQQKEKDVARQSYLVKSKEVKLQKLERKLVSRLEKLSGLTKKEAKKVLLDTLGAEIKIESQRYLKKMEEKIHQTAKQRAIDILVTTMQRYLTEQTTLHSSSVIHLPNEDIKGRIIGKEGRNIRTLEVATGMEFIIGEAPEVITISGFNPVRREIAKRALNILIQDGRINPTRIEETVLECEENINEEIEDLGKQAVVEFCLHNVHPSIISLLGKLNFRTSYTQNVLSHSKEVATLSKMIAYELGLDADLATRCGLLHDIGKAVSSEVEGSHASVGANLARQCGEKQIIANAIASHHEDVPCSSVYGVIIMIADTISASRPGARRESLASYIQRLDQLEEIATTFDGVKKSYAIQAGREVRVIVDEMVICDDDAIVLARDIAKKIEKDMNYPGQIKIHVIRESRVIEYAR